MHLLTRVYGICSEGVGYLKYLLSGYVFCRDTMAEQNLSTNEKLDLIMTTNKKLDLIMKTLAELQKGDPVLQ